MYNKNPIKFNESWSGPKGETPQKSIENKGNYNPPPTLFARTLTRTFNRPKRKEKSFTNSYEKARAVWFSRRGQRLSVRLCFFFSSFGLFSAFFLPISLLPHNVMSYYARLLCIRISFLHASLFMYSVHVSSLIETHVLLCDSVGWGFTRAREIETHRTDMIHNLTSHGALYV